jgi:hypothetical protein
MKIIQRRKRVDVVEYKLHFDRPGDPGSGYSFECDKDGNVDESKLHPCAVSNLHSCLCGEFKLEEPYVQKHESFYTEPCIGKCDACDEQVYLTHFTNTCDCGADYNMSGQRLAPREQWGEETGEHWSDCI